MIQNRTSDATTGRTATGGMAQPIFFKQPPPSTLAELAALTGAVLVDPARGGQVIRGLASLDEAGPMHLTFFDNLRYADQLKATKAGACLVSPRFEAQVPAHVAMLRAGQPFREAKLLQRVLQPAAIEAGLGRVTWHQFRHIHSSLMSDLRVPVKIAQEQLGHASIGTTLNTRTSSMPRTAVPLKRSKTDCSSIWTRMVSNRRGRSRMRREQVTALTRLRIGGAARI